MMPINRDQCREILELNGVSVKSVTDDDLKSLRRVLSKHLRLSGIYRGSARVARARKDLKFIQMKTDQWERREAISFNSDGFIGIAGWADNKNAVPVISALVEWSEKIDAARGKDNG